MSNDSIIKITNMENEWSIFKQKANILFTRRNLTAAFSMY